MGAISQAVFSNPFSLMTFVIFWFRFHWNLLLRAQLTITQHWFGWMPEAEQAQAVIWINDNLVYSASICQNHLKWISSGKHSTYFVNHIIALLREICLRIKMSPMKSAVGEFMWYDFIQKLKWNNVYISFILVLCWTQWPLGGTVVILHQES